MVHMFPKTFVTILTLVPILTGSIPLIAEGEGGPTRGHLDVAISDISLTGRFEDRFFPGDTVTIIVSIGHDNDPLPSDTPVGPQHEMKLVLIIEHSIDNITTIYRDIDTLPLNYSIDRNATYNPFLMEFFWHADFSYESDVTFTASLTITDDDTSDNGRGNGPIRFDHIRSEPLIWEEGQEDRTYESPEPHIVNVGETVNIPFEIQNRGGEVDTFEYVVLSKPQGWTVSLGGPHTIYSNFYAHDEMFVLVSGNPFEALADEEHQIVVKVRSIYEFNMTYDESTEHTFRFRVRFMSSAELYPESDNVYLTPGEAHQVYFQLRNKGNGVDDYTLAAHIDEVHVRKGWKVAFASGTRQPTVHPNQTFKIILRVQVPQDAPLNYVVILTLSLRSMKADYDATSDPCTIIADVRHAAKIEQFDDPIGVIPGRKNLINFNFTNEGNSKDPSLMLSVSYRPRGWVIVIDQAPLTQNGGIGPKTMVPLQMSVFVQETTVASSKGNLPYIVIQAIGGEFDRILDEERYYFRIPLVRKVELRCDTDQIVGAPGEEVQFNFTLENRGNWLDSFNVSLGDIELVFDEDPSQTEIAPNQTIEFKAAFLIPWNWPADSDQSTQGPTNGTMFDPYSIKLMVNSQNETELNSTLVSHPFELFILPRYDLGFEIVDGTVWKVPYDHDHFRTFLVGVRNKGNAYCELDVTLDTKFSWIRTVTDPIPLAYNEIKYIPVYLNYEAFEMEEFSGPFIDMVVSIHGVSSDFESFHHEIGFRFLPYTYYIEIVEIEDLLRNTVGSYLVQFGENRTFRVLMVRDGQSMYLPEEMDGPYVVMYIDGIERMRKEIPILGPGNKTYLEFGPMKILFTGEHIVEFAIEGMGSESVNGVSNWSLVITTEASVSDDSNKESGSAATIVGAIIFLIITIAMIGVGIFLYVKFFREEEESEVPEDGSFGFGLKINKN